MRTFNVTLSLTQEGREKKINAIKTWRSIFNMGLKDSKDFIEVIILARELPIRMTDDQLLSLFVNNHTCPTQQHIVIRSVVEEKTVNLDLTDYA